MKRGILLILVLISCLLASSCGSGPSGEPETDSTVSSTEIQVEAATEDKENPDKLKSSDQGESEEGAALTMKYDFGKFSNVNITGVDLTSLSDEQLAILYAQAKYCKAMTEVSLTIPLGSQIR